MRRAQVYDGMMFAGVDPDVVTFTQMLTACAMQARSRGEAARRSVGVDRVDHALCAMSPPRAHRRTGSSTRRA